MAPSPRISSWWFLVAGILLAGFAVAVQRDTPIRQWLAPQPQDVAAPLHQVVPRFEMTRVTIDEVVAEIGRQIGVRFTRAEPPASDPVLRFDLDLKSVTYAEVLTVALRSSGASQEWWIEADGNRLVLRTDDPSIMPRVARIYDLSELLPPEVVAPPNAPTTQPGIFATSPVRAQSEREEFLNAIVQLIESEIPELPQPSNYSGPPFRSIAVQKTISFSASRSAIYSIGSRLVVSAPEYSHQKIADLLHQYRETGGTNGRAASAEQGGASPK